MSAMHEYFLQRAIQLAENNVLEGGGPYGAIIVKDRQIIATGENRVAAHKDPTAHAEIIAIRSACRHTDAFKLTGCILYSSCEPCPMCLGAIYWARLAAVYFACNRFDAAQAGFDDSFIYGEINRPTAERTIPMRQIELADAETPFRTWNDLESKIHY